MQLHLLSHLPLEAITSREDIDERSKSREHGLHLVESGFQRGSNGRGQAVPFRGFFAQSSTAGNS
jgi:hypothetical protein